jgi:small subunit ribosomal protein S10e|mmetsp:Transcript_63543/g.102744  ORF Transcript_63543/g.102744 Transcript_63543/m.102744 type:complete len:94 (-) Transcript_63543:1293-1574(-)
MIIGKEDKITIYTNLFKNGVVVIKREKQKEKKSKSLQTKLLLKSLYSKGLVKETFSWQFYYYTLNDDGVRYLQNYLNIPEKVVPMTHKQPSLW